MNRQLHILFVEDDPSDALLALTMVNEVNLAGKALHVLFVMAFTFSS
jgi:hypothetical protein